MVNNEDLDYYTILGVPKYAKYREIKIAYRRLALKYHPDRNNSTFAEDIIKRINAAYEILSDKDKRKQYDNAAIFYSIPQNNEREKTWYSSDPDVKKNSSRGYSDNTDSTDSTNNNNANLKKGNRNDVSDKSEETTTTSTNNSSNNPKSRFQIIIEPSLCMAFGSCEVLAPHVFVLEKDKMINPKARVESETGADFETIASAAQTCPTKAIIIIDRYSGEQIYP